MGGWAGQGAEEGQVTGQEEASGQPRTAVAQELLWIPQAPGEPQCREGDWRVCPGYSRPGMSLGPFQRTASWRFALEGWARDPSYGCADPRGPGVQAVTAAVGW